MDLDDRMERVEDDIYRVDPENPGAIIRLDRIERMLLTMVRFGGALGGTALLWKALEVVGEIMATRAQPP